MQDETTFEFAADRNTGEHEGEFRSFRRATPRVIVGFLMVITFVYGLVLAPILPWTVIMAVSNGSLSLPLGIALAVFGSLFMTRWCVVQFLAFREHAKRLNTTPMKLDHYPMVSIIVPAHDESEMIISAISSLVALDYPEFEVVVIDDGSTDDTYEQALTLAGYHRRCKVTVLRKANGGKWSAMNLGFAHSTGEYVLFVDADSRLSSDALRFMVPRLREPGVVGVAGQVTIRNRDNMLTRFQALEYLAGNGGMRTALSVLGLVTVVPGPIGLYKRSAVEEIATVPWNKVGEPEDGHVYGPVSDATFAEDFELSLSALALGGKIVYESAANAYTRCPDTVMALLNQRYRWIRGTWQVFHIYWRDMREVAKERNVPLTYLMLALYPMDIYLVPIFNFCFWIFLGYAAASGLSLSLIFSWIVAVTMLNIMTSAVYVLAHDDDFSILPYIVGLDAYQSLLVNSAWVIAAIDGVRGTKMRWS